jgi:hypothetical protein
MTRKIVELYVCDICQKEMDDYFRSEKIRHTDKTEHYCQQCFFDNAHRCGVCGDLYVHLAEHKKD